MPTQDFTLSYTTTQVADWVDNESGVLGIPGDLFVSDIIATNIVGVPGDLFVSELISTDVLGVPGFISPSGFTVFTIPADIIHYSQDGAIKANQIILRDNAIVRSNNAIQTWIKQSNRIEVLVCETDLNLNINNSNALIINGNSGSGLIYKLPVNATKGIAYTIVNTSSSGTIVIDSQSDLIFGDNLIPIVNEIGLNSIGSKVKLQSDGNNKWVVLNSQNTNSGILNPNFFGGLSLHLDATDASSIVIGASPDVSQWNDLSGSGNHVSQSTVADRPHTGTTINGKNTLLFDGISQHLKNSTAGGTFGGNIGDFYCVVAISGANAFKYIMTSADEGALNSFMVFGVRETNKFSVNANDTGGTQGVVTSSVTTETPYIVRCYNDGSEWFIDLNGSGVAVTLTHTVNNGNWFVDAPNRDNLLVGGMERSAGPDFFYGGQIGEIIYYDGKILNSSDSNLLTNNLKAKWGIS